MDSGHSYATLELGIYKQCSNSVTASAATHYARESFAYLRVQNDPAPRYHTWLGTYTLARHDVVGEHFGRIGSNDFAGFNYYCTTDSKAGVPLHCNGGTKGFAYGQRPANQLAQSEPDKAIFNADNHEYFAENTPAQP
ncbi:hypothetical protein LXA43DRAFT_1067911 [Ganoderma leucocontextum]|nr:hypothetical protein LXA43DRAFT_1067911 [Ganoderma leucocontextum]